MEDLRYYFNTLVDMVRRCGWVIQEELSFRQLDEHSAYLKGELYLHGGYILHVAEYVVQRDKCVIREKYRYHLQDARQQRIARWDNAPHFPNLPGFPHHFHNAADLVAASAPMTLHCLLEKHLDDVLQD